jgi:mannose-6-phosphate isomerase-like protein (cupin superfamily)
LPGQPGAGNVVAVEVIGTQAPIVLTPEALAALPSRSLGTIEGVGNRVVWQDGESMAGVLTVEGGHTLGRHSHRANHHHMWVLKGKAKILNTEVGPGSYIHIPSGVEHDIDASATDGCTIFYLYLRYGV